MVYIDPPTTHPTEAIQPGARQHGHRWCHLWPDDPGSAEDLDHLHRIAEAIHLRRDWFQDKDHFPHYDLVHTRRRTAINAGAQPRILKEWVLEQRINPRHCLECRQRARLLLDPLPTITLEHLPTCQTSLGLGQSPAENLAFTRSTIVSEKTWHAVLTSWTSLFIPVN